jgi:hypothetical protein
MRAFHSSAALEYAPPALLAHGFYLIIDNYCIGRLRGR